MDLTENELAERIAALERRAEECSAQIEQLQAQLERLAARLERRDRRAGEFARLEEQQERLEAALLKFAARLPPEPKPPKVPDLAWAGPNNPGLGASWCGAPSPEETVARTSGRWVRPLANGDYIDASGHQRTAAGDLVVQPIAGLTREPPAWSPTGQAQRIVDYLVETGPRPPDEEEQR